MKMNHSVDNELTRVQAGITSPTHGNSGMGGQISANPSSTTTANGVSNFHRVFVQRDYRGGVAIRFANDFPPELNGRIDNCAYENTIDTINRHFEDAERFDCSTFLESCMGFITANLMCMCRDTRYEKSLKRISKFLAEQNQRVYLPRGLQIVDPLERGLRCIEIVIINESNRTS